MSLFEEATILYFIVYKATISIQVDQKQIWKEDTKGFMLVIQKIKKHYKPGVYNVKVSNYIIDCNYRKNFFNYGFFVMSRFIL